MKKILFLGLILFALVCNALSLARAQNLPVAINYLTALASYAAYDDGEAFHLRQVLRQEGWSVADVMADHPKAEVKFLLLEKQFQGTYYYLIAIAGTSSLRDVKTDLRYHTVGFGGHSLEEFKAYGANPSKEIPRIHSGFNDYVLAGFFNGAQGVWSQAILAKIKAQPHSKLIITGHSLGGAAAVVLGARLIDLGLPADKISVITYGAPAVGNDLFVAKYEKRLHLQRITMKGDGVKNLAQIVNPQLVQFNSNHQWQYTMSSLGKYRHAMVIYLDVAMEKYWQQQLADLSPAKAKYVAQLPVELPPLWQQYKPYLQYIIYTLAKDNSHNYIIKVAQKIDPRSKNGNYFIQLSVYNPQKGIYKMGLKSTAELTVLETMVYLLYKCLN